MTDRTAEHYERVAAEYDEHWSYDPDYVRRFADAITDCLRLTSSYAIADVGCGTGLYTRRIAETVGPTRPILCVDPVPAMLERLHVRSEPAAMDGVEVHVLTPDDLPPGTATRCSSTCTAAATCCSPASRARPRGS